jgi:hypothetical protein
VIVLDVDAVAALLEGEPATRLDGHADTGPRVIELGMWVRPSDLRISGALARTSGPVRELHATAR